MSDLAGIKDFLVADDDGEHAVPVTIEEAAANLLRLNDARRDAINGQGHPGETHNRVLGEPDSPVSSLVGDCSACAGTQYGIETELNTAWGDLRSLLGLGRKPWER